MLDGNGAGRRPNADEMLASLAPLFNLTPEQLARRAGGTDRHRAADRRDAAARREELGFSYIVVHEAEMDALAPVIAELAGT